MTPEVCFRKTCIAAVLLMSTGSCYSPSYQLALYDGAERLGDGPYFEYQKTRADCAVAAVAMMLRLNGQPVTYGDLRREVSLSGDGLSLAQIRDLMLRNGVTAKGVRVDPSSLENVELPLLAWLPTHHVVVLEKVTSTSAIVSDPGRGRWKMSRTKLSSAWDGTALVQMRPASRAPVAAMWSDTVRKHLTQGSYR